LKIAIVTDAWYPQINGVVRTLTKTVEGLRACGHDVIMITPETFRTVPCPTYPEIRLSIFPSKRVSAQLRAFGPECIHISTEGPLGLAARAFARRNQLAFTTAYHTRFPEYVRSRIRIPLSWTYTFLRWFHGSGNVVMAPTNAVLSDLEKWRIGNPVIWPRGVDLDLFKPATSAKETGNKKNPIFINVGRVAVEKNIEAFLDLDLPGEKWVVGGGPALERMKAHYPGARFFGPKEMEELPEIYNQADVFVFPSRTDTFGLVLLEAMACGLPVAAFPVTGPIDVIGDSGAGVLDEDLGSAAISAMKIKRSTARAHAKTFSWDSATDIFASHLVKARGSTDGYHIADNPHKDNHGITRAIAAARNSWAGLMFAFHEESAFRQELLLAAILVPLAIWMPATPTETGLMLASLLLVLIVELLNSSVEAAVDRISYKNHGLSKRAKDYGSAAVMLALLLCGITYISIGAKYYAQ
jgi:diacylglycerol kinase/glycosyltransferase involved in cell wall biosynthesis